MAPRPNKNGVFKRDRITDLLELAKMVPDKAETKEALTVGELIPRLWPAIGKFLNKRYNYRDIAKWMIEQGVSASEETLVTAIGDEARKHNKGRNTAKDTVTSEQDVKKTASSTNGVKAKIRVNESPAQAESKTSMNEPSPNETVKAKIVAPQPVQSGKHTSPAFNDDV